MQMAENKTFASAQGDCIYQTYAEFIWPLCFDEPYSNIDIPHKLTFSSTWSYCF